jgi:hypothetical protein
VAVSFVATNAWARVSVASSADISIDMLPPCELCELGERILNLFAAVMYDLARETLATSSKSAYSTRSSITSSNVISVSYMLLKKPLNGVAWTVNGSTIQKRCTPMAKPCGNGA